MAITQRTLQALKGSSISNLVEHFGGTLKRVGHEYLTQCLWHDDTNPSLTINDQKGFCFCHVCRGGGDAVDYVQKRKGLGFREACELTAEIQGIRFETDDENPEQAARRKAERRAAIGRLEKEQSRYSKNLRDARATRVKAIWKARGLGREAALEFGAGYAADGFFKGRITLPIHNHRGELVGFTGRATLEGQNAKYKNSQDSELFQKKQLVFNEPRGLEAARMAGTLIFVEGHLDVVSMWQAGIRNVVAMQGTGAPEPATLKRLTRSVKNFVLCFDGDAGGRKATEQFISVCGPMAAAGECNINVVNLPTGKDPDEVIRDGEDLYSYIAAAPSWLDWVIDTWAADLDKDDVAAIIEVEKQLKALINDLRSKALRTHYIDKAARVLSTTDKEAEKLAKSWSTKEIYESSAVWHQRDPQQVILAAERRAMRIFVHRPERRDTLRSLLANVSNPALRWLWERLQELEQCSTVDLTPHSVMAVVAVAEPHFMQQLRTLIRPNVIIDDSQGVIDHLRDIMGGDLSTDQPNESDSNQSLEGGSSEALF